MGGTEDCTGVTDERDVGGVLIYGFLSQWMLVCIALSGDLIIAEKIIHITFDLLL